MRKLSTLQLKTLAPSNPFKHRIKPLIIQWFRNYRTRKALSDMEPHRLRDIGIDPTQAKAERDTPFWR
ncbi:MAG: DUF1127 domain-containing protein [Paracoccaceae bacterium]